MLPYHQQAIANDPGLAFEHKQDRARRGPNVIRSTQRLSPRLIVDYELLTSQQIELWI